MWASLRVNGAPALVERVVALDPESARFEIRSSIEFEAGLPEGVATYATEWTFGAARSSARMALEGGNERAMGAEDERSDLGVLRLIDRSRGYAFELACDPPASVSRFPIETVSAPGEVPDLVLQGTRVFWQWVLPTGARRFECRLAGSLSLVDRTTPPPSELSEDEPRGDGERAVV
jgi:hypothetical protein